MFLTRNFLWSNRLPLCLSAWLVNIDKLGFYHTQRTLMLLRNLIVRFWYTSPHLLHADSVLHIHRGSFVRRHSFSKLIFGFILTTYTQFITIFVIASSSANIHSPMNGCLRTGNNQFIVFIYNFNLNTVFILYGYFTSFIVSPSSSL